jgi:hypothetical protein
MGVDDLHHVAPPVLQRIQPPLPRRDDPRSPVEDLREVRRAIQVAHLYIRVIQLGERLEVAGVPELDGSEQTIDVLLGNRDTPSERG